MLTDRYKVLISVVLTGCTGSQSDTQHQCLLDNQDEYGRQEEATIAARRIEDRYFLVGQRLYGNLIFAMRGIPTECHIHLRTEIGGHRLCRLIDGFVGHHQTHIGIYADGSLLHSIQSRGKVGRDIHNTVNHLFLHEVLCLAHIVTLIRHLHV